MGDYMNRELSYEEMIALSEGNASQGYSREEIKHIPKHSYSQNHSHNPLGQEQCSIC